MDVDNPIGAGRGPSYALEEDISDDDEWQQSSDEPALPSLDITTAKDAKITINGNVNTRTHVVFFVAEAGERIAKLAKKSSLQATVQIDNQQAGTITTPPGSTTTTLVHLSPSIPLASLHPLTTKLITTLAPSSVLILSSYHLPSYLSKTIHNENPPILYLRSTSLSPPQTNLTQLEKRGLVQPFLPPNLLHGLPASLLTSSVLHSSRSPSSTEKVTEKGTETLLLLFPTTSVPDPVSSSSLYATPHWQSSMHQRGLYDAGGPTAISDPDGLFGSVLRRVVGGQEGLGRDWDDWFEGSQREGGAEEGFKWLDERRRKERRENTSSMFL
ncbi:hypothetical protein T439DRAFT_376174 [Meredithblackwellia eburnea MCA 4105]